MAAGTQVAANGAERIVEIDEKCIGNLDMNNLNSVGDNSNGDDKDKSVDSFCVLVSGGDPGDIGGGVSGGDATAISGSADEVDRFSKEESGLGNSGVVVDLSVLETNAVNNDSVSDAVVKAFSDDVDIVNRSAVDSFLVMETSVIGQDFDGEAINSNDQLADTKEIADVEDLESTVNTTETSQVTDFNPESISNPALNADCEVMVNDESESFETVINKTECQSAVDVSGKPYEDLVGQVADWSESSESPIIEREAHVTVDRSGKLSEGLDCQKVADRFESSGSIIEEQEHKGQVTVDPSESIGSLVDNQQHPVSVDDSEPISDNTKEVDPSTIVMESDVKSEEHQELLIKTLEVNESEPLLLNADEEKPEETQVKDDIERSLKFTESEELVVDFEMMTEQVKRENNIQESQTVVTDNVQDYLNLESNTAESANVADVSLETVVDQKAEHGSDIVAEYRAAEGIDFETGIENVDVPDDDEKETEAQDPVRDHRASSYPDTVMNPGSVIEFGSFGSHETIPNIVNDVIEVPNVIIEDIKSACGANTDNPEQNVDGSHTDRNSDNGSSVSDAIDVQDEEDGKLVYNRLVKIPRFEDESVREDIRSAQSEVTEKTSVRDAIRAEILERRNMLRILHEALKEAFSEENKARRLVKSKRQEIDSVLAVINRWKNAMSVEDFDNRILSIEYMIQHETIQLKDEKEFIREIKRLKSLRDHLASNMGSHEEIRQAIDQKDQNEERLKTLRKELDALKANVSKAEEVVKVLQNKYENELSREREMQNQFRAANSLRQQAYAHLNSLKKLLYDKNQHFRQFKEDQATARRFHKCGDNDSLQRLCRNQMETFMEKWNNDDEFRKEYINMCNMNASRRQRALNRESVVNDDVAPALPCEVIQKDDTTLVPVSVSMKSLSDVLAGQHEKAVSLTENNKLAEDSHESIENVSGKKNQTLESIGDGQSSLRSDVATVAELAVVSEVMEDKKDEEDVMTKEEIELARKADELMKEEIEAKLKEQRRVEEKAKAMEALERKKRNAEKAQIKAEMWARKEAEQKEKEREKRLRKKEKKTGGDRSLNGEDATTAASSGDVAAKELEIVSEEQPKKKAHKPPPHFFSKQLKPRPVPPPHLTKHKKTWQYYLKIGIPALAFLAIIVLVLIGNNDYNVKFKVPRQRHV